MKSRMLLSLSYYICYYFNLFHIFLLSFGRLFIACSIADLGILGGTFVWMLMNKSSIFQWTICVSQNSSNSFGEICAWFTCTWIWLYTITSCDTTARTDLRFSPLSPSNPRWPCQYSNNNSLWISRASYTSACSGRHVRHVWIIMLDCGLGWYTAIFSSEDKALSLHFYDYYIACVLSTWVVPLLPLSCSSTQGTHQFVVLHSPYQVKYLSVHTK